ncbi:MAG: putative zinc-binding metallopeptidase [Cellvibrionaceae bacterium]
MKTFQCVCGQRVFFENTSCNQCGRALGFDPQTLDMLAFDLEDTWRAEGSGVGYKPCSNYVSYDVCNWVIPEQSRASFCLACSLNEMIPAIASPQKRGWWAKMELAKRRLVVTLLRLKLKVVAKRHDPQGLGFAFLEDKRMNPAVREHFVATGHAHGLITVNLAEADPARREMARQQMGESYRTLLGHFRHESGHYYFDQLIKGTKHEAEFRQLFGDERKDYDAALRDYYDKPPPSALETGFISDYAQAHPLEDWAECWAHYLHMVDTLETAAEFGLVEKHFADGDIDQWLLDWSQVTVALNALNRSMGFQDACPFVYSETTVGKIRFIHRAVCSCS